jgi:hypothetical protein
VTEVIPISIKKGWGDDTLQEERAPIAPPRHCFLPGHKKFTWDTWKPFLEQAEALEKSPPIENSEDGSIYLKGVE